MARSRCSRSMRQADWIVVVGAPAARSVSDAVRRAIAELTAGGCTPTVVLVLVQPAWRAHPIETAARAAGFDAHFHVRSGADADVERLARHLTGAAVGLVLSGGGARSMAHLGAYRALVEAGIPIDRVGGSSIGGVVAAQIAAGGDPDELVRRSRAAFRTARVGQRLTVPVLSLLSPAVVERSLERMFGDADLEDLWLPCFVTAVDLTACRLVILDRGPVRRWALATASPPGCAGRGRTAWWR